MRFRWQDLIDDLIEDGRRRGLFENLAGSGRPLDLQQNVYEGSNTLANKLMKENDLQPAWMLSRNAVTARIEQLRDDIDRTWQRYRVRYQEAQGADFHRALSIGWDEACRRWEETVSELNREMTSYNLKRPAGMPEMFKLSLAEELKRAGAVRHLGELSV
jgi:hypothetical protein